MCTSKLIFHMYKLQACSKSHGDKIQQILLAAYWCLLHSHLDEEPHQESLPPGQGKAWEGLPGAPKGQCQTNSTPASGKRGRWGGGGRISCWSPPVIFFSCCIVRLEIYSCGAKVFDSPSIAVALWCCLWVAVKQFCSSLYISSTSFWNGDDEFFLTSLYNVRCTYIGFLSQQSWH